jgi:hypothetical protein
MMIGEEDAMEDKTEAKANDIVEYMMDAPISAADMTWMQLQKAQRDAARDMSRSRLSVPPYLRDNPYDCLGIVKAARQWGLENEYFVAQNSYITTDRYGIERLAYTSVLYQAVLTKSKAIIGRAQYSYEGEGNARTCTVGVLDRETREWQNATTPPLAKCRKNSPLWDIDPDQQLAYFAIRRLVRQKYSEVFGGLYDHTEFDDAPPEPSPTLLERLPGRIEGAGFSVDLAELQRDEAAAVAAVQAEQTEKKVKRKGGWRKGVSRAAVNAAIRARKAAEQKPEAVAEEPQAPPAATAAPTESQSLAPSETAAEPETQPAAAAAPVATPRLPIDEPPRRGPPQTLAEFPDYMARMSKGIQSDVVRWFDTQDQVALRQTLGLSGDEIARYRRQMQELQDARNAEEARRRQEREARLGGKR